MKSRLILLTILFSVILSNTSVVAQHAEVPISYQIAIIKQIMIADRVIKSNSNGMVLIVNDANTLKKAELMANTFKKQGIKAEVTTDLSAYNGKSINVIYFMSDTITKPAFINEEKILTVAANSQLTEDGHISLAIRNSKTERPEIVVNRSVIEDEGHGNLISSLPKAVIL